VSDVIFCETGRPLKYASTSKIGARSHEEALQLLPAFLGPKLAFPIGQTKKLGYGEERSSLKSAACPVTKSHFSEATNT